MKNDQLKFSTIPSLNVSRMVNILSISYINLIKKGISLKTMPSVMLWGAPGVGKSQGVHEIAEIIKKETNKKVVVTDVRLLLFNPIDLRGIPTSNPDKTLAIWLKPKIFDMDPSENTINILFLDEISAAPMSVQAAAYQITLDRVVGEHKLPDNCIVIAAGNRVTDKSVAYNMPKALANRLMHFEIETDFESWKNWAYKNNINDLIIGFLSFRPDYLMNFNSDSADELAFATPRTWEMASNVLNNVSNNFKIVYPIISGLLGKAVATELKAFKEVYMNLPDIDQIFEGYETRVPKKSDEIFALITSMISYAKKYRNNVTKLENSIKYASLLPTEYATVLFNDYMDIDEKFKNVLMSLPSFSRWASTRGKLLNAIK